jgi:sugar phosphate isomerase/epimerase
MDKFLKTALIGYTGFVGSNLHFDYRFTDIYNSKNISEIANKNYDCVVCAGISAKKWYANLHPDEDKKQIDDLIDILKTAKVNKFIFISTIDVYDQINIGLNEDYVNLGNTHAYGRNRLYAENSIKELFDDYCIIRLPGLFGFGLRKNIIYDYLNNNLKELSFESEFQWYDVADLIYDINKAIESNLKVVNLFTEPIKNYELVDVFKKYNNGFDVNDNQNFVTYNTKTKYDSTGYVQNKAYVLRKIDHYIKNIKSDKLIISNLSWKHNDNSEMLVRLQDYGIKSLELAPYKYFGMKVDQIVNPNKSIPIYSFQAVLYPMIENVFGCDKDREILHNYLISVINIAAILGVKVLVFGSPKNRKRGELTSPEAYNIAVPFFKKLGDYAISKDCVVCIEPNSKVYGCDFINNSIEGRDLVLRVNSEGFKLHLDVGCMLLENENIIESIHNNLDILHHIHFSAPDLQGLSGCQFDYGELLSLLREKYTGKVSIEMLNLEDYDVIRNVRHCLTMNPGHNIHI